jgi:glycosyltransferase involved in cell wall biosynthesis
MTVDIERFSHVMIKNEKSTNFIFKYCGGGNYERDGLINMIEAFIDLKKINKNFEFQIIGPINNNSHYYQKAVTIIEQNKAQDKIKFLGSKSSNEIPGLLSRADCLIMTPPKDFDSGGFPTKLGEYLATGIPVICTKVSEIPIYLNESSAILVAPNNHNALVEVLIRVISNYNFCKVIGINGKIMAQKYFSAEAHTKRVIQFLKIY